MTATERVLTHFARISETIEAIPRLRRFVLDLAVRGKLADRDPSDEPASELLRRTACGPARRSSRPLRVGLPSVAPDEEPFDVPESWRWARLAHIVDFSAGRTPSRNDSSFWNTGDYAWVSIADMHDGQLLTSAKESVSARAREQVFGGEPEPPGTMLMSFKLTIGKIARLGIPAFHNEAIISIRPHVADMDAYLFRVLPQFARQGNTKGAIKGATLNRDSISSILIPIPPLAEQHRIVAKVDELMALCDRLEAAQQERERRRDRLVRASLACLNQPADTPSFREHARFHLQQLPRMTHDVRHVQRLRRTIINLAIRGALVGQNQGDMAPTAGSVEVKMADTEAPEAWRSLPLADLLAEDTRNGYSRKPDDAVSGIPILRISAGTSRRDGIVAEEDHKLIGGITQHVRSQYGLKNGDLLACRFNGNKAFVGRLALFQNRLALDPIYPDKLIRIRLAPHLAVPAFIRLAGEADMVRRGIEEACATTVGNWGISASNLKEVVFPVPPLAEQHRIVAKVDELMTVCDRLEAQLEARRAAQAALLEATLRDALAEGTPARAMPA
jgi:type I restriction enzyme S subunit